MLDFDFDDTKAGKFEDLEQKASWMSLNQELCLAQLLIKNSCKQSDP